MQNGKDDGSMKKLDYKHYGLNVYEVGNKTYALGTENQVDDAARLYIKDSLWAFNARFLENYIELPEHAIKHMQGLCEDCNDALLKLVGERFEQLCDAAIASDGVGHYLSSYDGETCDGSVVGKKFIGLTAVRLS